MHLLYSSDDKNYPPFKYEPYVPRKMLHMVSALFTHISLKKYSVFDFLKTAILKSTFS